MEMSPFQIEFWDSLFNYEAQYLLAIQSHDTFALCDIIIDAVCRIWTISHWHF